jgi:hypothetical protein
MIRQTTLWKRTLGGSGGGQAAQKFRSRLRSAFEAFRSRAKELANTIPDDLRHLTVHGMDHIDALWEVTDILIADEYPINPTEAFILGAAFLVHDLGLALASYPNGIDDLKRDEYWQDAIVKLLRQELGRWPRSDEIAQPSAILEQSAVEQVLRLRHAKQAEDLVLLSFQHKSRDPNYFLLEDSDLRQAYGGLIGRIAYSHWWSIDQLVADGELNRTIGAFPDGPKDWSIQPAKLAILLRNADACDLNAKRAPGFLRALRKPVGHAELHWRIQEYLQKPIASKGRILFTSTKPVPIEDRDAWWVGYDLLQVADKELRDSEGMLSELGLPPLAINGVAGATNARQLARHIPTKDWSPVDTSVKCEDVASLVKKVGGTGLYGNNPTVTLRELIQNARDAVVARRLLETRGEQWGKIIVRLVRDGDDECLEVEDIGVGMSEELLSGPLLDFGTSYWQSFLSASEHPGLFARGFQPQGSYGIGFFSVFMLGDRVKVVTRCPADGIHQTRVLEFSGGLDARPVIRSADNGEWLNEPGTIVRVWLREKADDGLLAPRVCTSEYLDKEYARRSTPWSLGDLCEWLCPCLDVNLVVESGADVATVLHASDWKTITGKDLLRRLLLHREDCREILAAGTLDRLAGNIRELRDPCGEVIGRAALTRWIEGISTTRGRRFQPPGVVTAGCFRAFAWVFYPGVMLGRPKVAARHDASRIAFDYPKELADWATEQGDLARNLTNDVKELAELAMLVRLFNGDTGDLPIAQHAGSIVSFRDLAGTEDLPNEITLEPLLADHDRFDAAEGCPGNVVRVLQGRTKPTVDGPPIKDDFRRRADHPRWRQYWMSLWGATIEAIAAAWGRRLQEVLDASEIHSEPFEEIEHDGRTALRPWPDILRKPP